jgi:acetolactate synthase-1/2/3 large subunit
VDFLRIAEGFGVPGVDLDASPDPAAALAAALHTPGPVLIHARHVQDNVFPMVPPGAANKDMIGGESHATCAGH